MSATSKWKHRFSILNRITGQTIYKLLGQANKSLQPQELFCIKAGYHHAVTAESFDDTVNKDEWQQKVYELAAVEARILNNPSVIDVGCGSAYKLVQLLGHLNTTGIEVEPAYSWLCRHYPERKWISFESVDPYTLYADIVICSDVIEHIKDPDDMMNFLSAIQFKYLIISTPERDIIRGKKDYGPPINTAHYREWNAVEFKQYAGRWFEIKQQVVVEDKSISQVIVATKMLPVQK